MPLSTFDADPDVPLILDASVAINLNATGIAALILSALPKKALMTPEAISEVRADVRSGRDDAVLLLELIQSGVVEALSLNDVGLIAFEGLVIGPANATLDDGEAATIAAAFSVGAAAVLDDAKAHRIADQSYQTVCRLSTVDLLACPSVARALGEQGVVEALVAALSGARMRVLPHRLKWVIERIGIERAKTLYSLPKSAWQPR